MRKLYAIGDTFGCVTVIAEAEPTKNNPRVMGHCNRCNSERIFFIQHIRMRPPKKCLDCPDRSQSTDVRKASLYWRQLRRRRQIVESWSRADFIAAVGVSPKGKPYIVRPNPSQLFSPDNWRWAGRWEGVPNRRADLHGKRLRDWAEEFGITKERVRQLLNKHGTIEAVINHRRKPMREQLRGRREEKRKMILDYLAPLSDGQIHVIPLKEMPCSMNALRHVIESVDVEFKTAFFDNGATLILQSRKPSV